MLTILIVRHGETDWNAQLRIQGSVDIPLNDLGRSQAKVVAKYLSKIKFDAIYSSDLSRAYDTASEISALQNLEITQTELIREIGYGAWEGLTWEDIAEKGYEKELAAFKHDEIRNRPPEGETIEALLERTGSFLSHVKEKHQGDQTICVVAHGGTIRAFATHAVGGDAHVWSHMRIANCAVSTITISETGHTELFKLNDTSFLD